MCLTRVLRSLLYSDNGVAKAGVPLVLHGAPYLLRARVRIILTDGGAWPQALQWGGAGCIKPCFKHGNVLRRGCVLSPVLGDDFVEITCFDTRRSVRTHQAQLFDDVDSVAEAARLNAEDPFPMPPSKLKR